MDFSTKTTDIDKNRAATSAQQGKSPLTARKDVANTSFATAKPVSSFSNAQAQKTSAPTASQNGHKLELDHERAMSMTGVKDVPIFTDKNITVRLGNETLLVTGQNLAVKTLDIENGKLQVTGKVFSLRYTSQAAPTSIIKRIFK